MNHTKYAIKFILVTLMLSSFTLSSSFNRPGDNSIFLYGTITTVDGERFTGQLRWGDEEATWQDLFNSQKIGNEFEKYLDRDAMRRNEEREDDSWNFRSLWQDRGGWSPSNNHTFTCLFGDISQMRITGRREVELEFKNGARYNLRGGSNDVGEEIIVFDPEIGKIEMDWSRIDRVRFAQMPGDMEIQTGEALYGVVKTREGDFEGYIQWDEDEATANDKLDGDSKNGDLSIAFSNIESIARGGRGSDVVLKSGRELYLTGSNDVNSENRGIIVKHKDWGRVKIGWRAFESVSFTKPQKGGLSYNDFDKPKRLTGRVRTREGKTYSGMLAYDLDEIWDAEILDGEVDDMEYKIPFRLIESITPKNYEYANVKLKSGKTLLLGDSNDVSDRNDGILIFKNENDEEPDYVAWNEVAEVTFN